MSPAQPAGARAYRVHLAHEAACLHSNQTKHKMVDALQRPFLRISPEFGTYAEEHGVFDLFEVMLKELLIARPENPLDFLVKLLSKPIIDGMTIIRFLVIHY